MMKFMCRVVKASSGGLVGNCSEISNFRQGVLCTPRAEVKCFSSVDHHSSKEELGDNAQEHIDQMNSQNGVHSDDIWPPGTEVIATSSFTGRSAEDLSFEQNDCLIIVAPTKDSKWYRAQRKDKKQGLIPKNYVRKKRNAQHGDMPWFHTGTGRQDAEHLLHGCANGTFLVRESTNYPGDYTLCVIYQGKVEHYRIQFKDHLLTCDDEAFFETLSDLVAHYTDDADGLCCNLVRPLDRVFKSWSIQARELVLGDCIGKGEFSEVYSGTYRGQKVAVKVLKDRSLAKSLLKEAELMISLKHRNLVQFRGVINDGVGEEARLVTEFMPNGNLVEFLRTRGRLQVTLQQQIQFACDVCDGMAYLEGRSLAHRDLAARNVLLAEDMTAKVSDFGLAKKIPDASSHSGIENLASTDVGGKFPIKWSAPEALRHNFSSKSDVWAFGVLLWEIYSFGRVPYPRIPAHDVVRHIEKGYRMESPDGCPTEISKIMSEAWELDPTRRPTFNQMLHRLQRLREQTANNNA